MKNIDDFDRFLKDNFQKGEINIPDDGFTDNVLRNLPKSEPSLKRNLILYLACTIAVLIFIISSGYKSLFMSMIDVFNNGIHMVRPSLISFVVISVFIGVSICIARIEYDKNLV
jgi:hypothetical protein